MTKKSKINRRRETTTTAALVMTDPQQHTSTTAIFATTQVTTANGDDETAVDSDDMDIFDNAMQSPSRVDDGATWTTMTIDRWSIDHVAQWLTETGFEKYAQLIAYHHQIDGATLLLLDESDMRQKPLELTCLGDVKRLSKAIGGLRETHNQQSNDSRRVGDESTLHETSTITKTIEGVQMDRKLNGSCTNGILLTAAAVAANYTVHQNGRLLVNRHYQTQQIRMTREELIRRVESPDTKEKSLFKLVVAFIYCLCSLLITAFVMVLVHDRVPDMKTYPPLPDIVLDNVPLIPWAFEVCEVIAVSMTTIWFINLFFHKHRIVVMRRMFSLVGTVFLLRCITMMITSMSVPGVHLECRAKSYGTLWQKIVEAYYIWSRLGMSVQGVRSCGDYMFSGHTTVLTLLNHFITEYTPDSWHFLHTSTWVLNLFGIFFILAGHEHYSIDVFIAFYISSRMFLYYHAYAYNHPKLTAADSRMRFWFPLGWFFEAGGCGRVENEYEFPIYIPHPAAICDRLIAALAMLKRKSRNESTVAESAVLSKKCATKNGYKNGSIGMNGGVTISKMK